MVLPSFSDTLALSVHNVELKGGSAGVLYKCGWNQNKKLTSKVIKAKTGSKNDRIKQRASVTTVCRQKGKNK